MKLNGLRNMPSLQGSHKKQCKPLSECIILKYADGMTHSTITDKFQTTIPLQVRRALKLKARQRVSYELRPDGSVLLRPAPGIAELFGSIKLNRQPANSREEKNAARAAIAKEAAREGL